MFGHTPSTDNTTEVTTPQALEIAELLQRYFSHLPSTDLIAAAQVNSTWSRQANEVLRRTDVIGLDSVEDKKLWVQLTSVAPTVSSLILSENPDPKEQAATAKEFIALIRTIAEKFNVTPGIVIKHFATLDRCVQFSHLDKQELAMLMELPVLVASAFKIDFLTASRLVNFIQASNMSFPLMIIAGNDKLIASFKNLTDTQKLSFMEAYILLSAHMLNNNSAWGEDSPVKDCEKAIKYLLTHSDEWQENLAAFKQAMQAEGLGDNMCESLTKMDNKAFDCLLAHTILSGLRPEGNKALVAELANIAKTKQENVLTLLLTVAGLINNNPAISNENILASLTASNRPSPMQ